MYIQTSQIVLWILILLNEDVRDNVNNEIQYNFSYIQLHHMNRRTSCNTLHG